MLKGGEGILDVLSQEINAACSVPGRNAVLLEGFKALSEGEKVRVFSEIARRRFKKINDISMILRNRNIFVARAFSWVLEEHNYPFSSEDSIPFLNMIKTIFCTEEEKERRSSIETMKGILAGMDERVILMFLPLFSELNSTQLKNQFLVQIAFSYIVVKLYDLSDEDVSSISLSDSEKESIAGEKGAGRYNVRQVFQKGLMRLVKEQNVLDRLLTRLEKKKSTMRPLLILPKLLFKVQEIYSTQDAEYTQKHPRLLAIMGKIQRVKSQASELERNAKSKAEMESADKLKKEIELCEKLLVCPKSENYGLSDSYIGGVGKAIAAIERYKLAKKESVAAPPLRKRAGTTGMLLLRKSSSASPVEALPTSVSDSIIERSASARKRNKSFFSLYKNDEWSREQRYLTIRKKLSNVGRLEKFVYDPDILQGYFDYAMHSGGGDDISFMLEISKILSMTDKDKQLNSLIHLRVKYLLPGSECHIALDKESYAQFNAAFLTGKLPEILGSIKLFADEVLNKILNDSMTEFMVVLPEMCSLDYLSRVNSMEILTLVSQIEDSTIPFTYKRTCMTEQVASYDSMITGDKPKRGASPSSDSLPSLLPDKGIIELRREMYSSHSENQSQSKFPLSWFGSLSVKDMSRCLSPSSPTSSRLSPTLSFRKKKFE